MKRAKFWCKSEILLAFFIIFLCVAVLSACGDTTTDDTNNNDDIEYFATFVLNNGEENVNVKNGESIPNPSKDGYVFAGWYLDSEFNTPISFDDNIASLSEDIIVYAKWVAVFTFDDVEFEDLTVDYDGNPHSIPLNNLPEGTNFTYTCESEYTLPGEYTITVALTKDGYQSSTKSATLTINALEFDGIIFDDVTIDYDGESHTISPSGVGDASVEYVGDYSFIEPGVYTIKVKISKTGYTTIEKSATLTISSLTFENIKFDDKSVTYDGTQQSISPSNIPDGALVRYLTSNAYTNAGEYVVHAEISKAGYTTLDVSAMLTINKADVTGIVFEDGSVVWDGNTHGISVDNLPSGVAVSYQNNGHSEVGIYTVVATFDGGANYNSPSQMSATLTIIAKQYTVLFKDGDGEEYSFTVEREDTLDEIPTPLPKVGYFASWDVDCSGAIMQDMVATATYSAIVYTITYNFNNGAGNADVKQYTIEDDVLLTWSASRRGYEFGGWYEDVLFSGNSIDSWNKGDYHKDITLYAKWNTIEYDIIYDYNGTMVTPNSNAPTYYSVATGIVTLTSPTRVGYDFVGWVNKANDQPIESIDPENMQGDVTLKAIWEESVYNISYTLNGGDNDEQNKATYSISTSFELAHATRKGYEFLGWFDENETPIESTVGIYKHLSLSAKWQVEEYTLTYDNTKSCLNENPANINIEECPYALKPLEKDGYNFDGWTLKGNPITQIDKDNIDNLTLVAVWSAKEYSIVYNLDGGDNPDDNPSKFTIDDIGFVFKPASKGGFDFVRWYRLDGDNKVSVENITAIGDMTIYAEYQAQAVANPDWEVVDTSIKYVGEGSVVTIPYEIDGITIKSIDSGIFNGKISTITSITVSEGIENIDANTFSGATALETLVLPSTIKAIPNRLLQDCSQLKNLTIPYVGDTKFEKGVTNKTYATFSYLFSSTQKDGYYSVSAKRCEVSASGDLSELADGSFNYLPSTLENVTVLGGDLVRSAFAFCTSIKNINLGGGTYIGDQAFRGCIQLANVVMSSSFVTFGNNILYGVSGYSVTVANQTQKNALIAVSIPEENIVVVG